VGFIVYSIWTVVVAGFGSACFKEEGAQKGNGKMEAGVVAAGVEGYAKAWCLEEIRRLMYIRKRGI